MKTLSSVLLVSVLLLLSACSPKVNDPADVQAIRKLAADWDNAFNAGNINGLLEDYTSDVIHLGPNEAALAGTDAMRTSFQSYFDAYKTETHGPVEDVRVSGNLAVARGVYTDTSSPKAGGTPINRKGKWVSAYQRQADGSWKIFWDVENSDLPVSDSLPLGVEEQAVMQVEREWAAASARNDWAALDKMLAAEYANNTDGSITPKKQILANMKGGASKVASATAGEMKVLVLGETAIAHGLWMEKSTLNGKDTSGTYRYTDTFMKRDGRWQAATTYSTKLQ
ncbi:MAG: SgcJ/EcaC family oxidoreductase [Spirochaetes bacterium]|nr:SgcJ/EcaC family oxidoreductase [Spirochaetota bacterium]